MEHKWKYVAMNFNGDIYFFTEKPNYKHSKQKECWESDNLQRSSCEHVFSVVRYFSGEDISDIKSFLDGFKPEDSLHEVDSDFNLKHVGGSVKHKWKYVAKDGLENIYFYTKKPMHNIFTGYWFAHGGDLCSFEKVVNALKNLYEENIDISHIKTLLKVISREHSLFEVDEDFNLTKVED